MKENGVPGDETERDGFIRTTLQFDEQLRAYSPQTWIVRITDQDNSTATASLMWDIPVDFPSVTGSVVDAATGEPLTHVLLHFRDAYFPESDRLAITDSSGSFAVQLSTGDWHVQTTHVVNQEYQNSMKALSIQQNQTIPFMVKTKKFDAFVTGQAHFENNAPVENITVALQNTQSLEIVHARTDEQGYYKVGVAPGEYVFAATPYFSRYLGNHYWPHGFFAQPSVDTVSIQHGEIIQNLCFRPYTSFIRGVCMSDGKPLADVLVQGVAIDPETNEQKLYQTFSHADGSYALGILQRNAISVVAQKEGYTPTPLAGFPHIDLHEKSTQESFNFQFKKQHSLMSLSGHVYGQNSQPLSDVYVIAYNVWEHTPRGHLITQTDARGQYFFDIKVEGDWQIGIYKKDAEVQPDMYYKYMSPGLKYNDLNFVVSSDLNARTNKGRLVFAEFGIVPHFPNPFFKETIIDLVLPSSSHTHVEVLDMDGNELTTLVDHDLSGGFQKVRWDGTDDFGNVIANGVYLCRIKSKESTTVVPITLLR